MLSFVARLFGSRSSGITLNAISMLGFGPPGPEAFPEAVPGEISLRYGGWSLTELRRKHPDLLCDQDWYDRYPWASERLPSGFYVLRLPVPESNGKTFEEQQTLLLPGEEPAAVVLAATALLALRVSSFGDPLRGDFTRCKEETDDGNRVGLYWCDRRLYVRSDWGDFRFDGVWLSAARTTG